MSETPHETDNVIDFKAAKDAKAEDDFTSFTIGPTSPITCTNCEANAFTWAEAFVAEFDDSAHLLTCTECDQAYIIYWEEL